jgi:hypothetical protein
MAAHNKRDEIPYGARVRATGRPIVGGRTTRCASVDFACANKK